uniref:Uncharacterized protein n=2 Tax=Anser TaxID=8842 RepID=A0A8B9B953_9AVES
QADGSVLWWCFSHQLSTASFCPQCACVHPFVSCLKAPRGFILVHLNIHDSLHFCSKRHLFI